ncbi:MAG: tyrosine--tRNA ligase [Parcubacteria group bacterium CG10_big_fil_rev_8_21_14_0_10_36_14]|nr:MAG: tyrosine--tRNA ligase [Parcubacteria group bacterium CG10_big_fil_rev_8_21_14_0_10_36_14]
MDKIKELLTRGVENVYPTPAFLEKLLKSKKKLIIYAGYDPTGPTLHIGHGITMLKLRQFQQLGHKIIFLIGDFTGMIGDPTDKSSTRQQLTKEDVLKNCKEYKKQASAILDFNGKNPVEIKYNSKWFSKMDFADVLQLSSRFTVQRMMERDMFQERIKAGKPIYVHEFMYPMMQAYDSVVMDVDGEVGGNDQTFNMLAGRDLMKIMKNKEKFVLTMKLLTDTTGKKMGKSEGNMVALFDSPEDMFGKVMSWPDEMIISGFELCTIVPTEQVESMKKEIKKNPRELKIKLASEIVKLFLGEASAKRGKAHFESVIVKKDVPLDMPEYKLKGNKNIADVLVESKLCSSKSDARRAVEQGGVSLDNKKIKSFEEKATFGILKKGKRHFVKLI